jgi:hypothetical protein
VHYEEVGVNAVNERILRNQEAEILSFVPSDAVVTTIYARLSALGSLISRQEVARLLRFGLERKQKALAKVRDSGLRSVQGEIVDFLNRRAIQFANSSTSTLVRLKLVANPAQWTQEACAQMQLIIDTMFLVATMNAFACGLGCAPCCIIAVTEAAAAAALQLWKDGNCLLLPE